MSEKKVITVAAMDGNLDAVTGFVGKVLEETECSVKVTAIIMVCLEEMAVNVFHYAYKDITHKTGEFLTVEVYVDDGSVTLTLIDAGVPFNPLERAAPDITLPAEEREIGGLGIHIVRQKMDDVSYRHENGNNILTMVKKF